MCQEGHNVCENRVEEEGNGEVFMETRAGASADSKEVQDIVDKSEPTASSTMSKKGRTEMGKRIKTMSPLYSIYEAGSCD